MAQTKEEIHVPGVWGPFFNTMIPDLWLLKGGQSVSGKLIDHIIDTHPASASVKEKCNDMYVYDRLSVLQHHCWPHFSRLLCRHITQYLNNLLYEMSKRQKLDNIDELTNEIHIWPDFHGNRSPVADPNLRGMVRISSRASYLL